ncbi:MAG: zinc-ribbon domain-containing protein [Methanomassiliicoccus sp.]|nr:zinc-ribbon domain-containing protein [Methanomassiliicoccus sp.]
MVEPVAVNCPYCGSELAIGTRFCPSCGAPQTAPVPAPPAIRFCPHCGNQNPATSSFCPRCGTNLQTPWTPPYQLAPPVPPGGVFGPVQRRNNRTVVVIVAIALVVVLILVAVIASGVLYPDSSANTKVGDGRYSWTFNGKIYTLSVNISAAEYQYYHTSTVQRYATTIDEAVSMCDEYVTPNDSVVQEVAQELESMSASFSDVNKANFVLSFVQNIKYVEDEVSVSEDEYWRFPVETLYDEAGDCEDKAFLYASIMEAMNDDAVILLYDGHAAAGISVLKATGTYYEFEGKDYFYCETTAVGWKVGEIPDEYGSAYIAQVG